MRATPLTGDPLERFAGPTEVLREPADVAKNDEAFCSSIGESIISERRLGVEADVKVGITAPNWKGGSNVSLQGCAGADVGL